MPRYQIFRLLIIIKAVDTFGHLYLAYRIWPPIFFVITLQKCLVEQRYLNVKKDESMSSKRPTTAIATSPISSAAISLYRPLLGV